MRRHFLLYLACLTVYVLTTSVGAYKEGYAFAYQVLELSDPPQKFLTFWGNAANWSDLFIVNVVLAYVLSTHTRSWSLKRFVPIFTVVAIVGIFGYLEPLLKDSLTTPSAFFREGRASIAGVTHQIYWTVGVSISLSYYLLTPRKGVATREVVTITALLMVHHAISVMHPPYAVHGSVHWPAIWATTAGWIVLPLLAAYRAGLGSVARR
ncbi:hypothetical protein A3H16_01175 [Candidatus Kaiserbacteria bacterium RIFCSPLOWO2_12_FULL_53_8]|uniref:DUF998 domain-containing protein n=2 Tax=Candidatus Kaiseribacteriota TaxID=1752734 RepID=A0A1F6CTG3_9BACT|nr:MAG: hypothetical protein A2851_04885 [Candidatus Kaiserbacteria bacterium RIFCSPHIGHO2_01_FULL_53_29]OGG90891.1 MAG: hypothetical protein A3H16_01175 [Candidatus Kaiserbacteria bacterium RIFCSPLOWO2_12_FULL_53_8]